ncbi:MAG TPA: IPTL-CTERM sorting domain-containing protein [Thermoanaerobaculia bacterium]|nr:IPTL-CTERM sorting domain-containing protein [Thermoanaerobaculia bacterium]
MKIHPRSRSVAVLAIGLLLSPTILLAATKEQMHEEMAQLAEEMRQLKPSIAGDPTAAASYNTKAVRYRQISAALGGDEPVASGAAPAAGGPPTEGTSPTPPAGCTATTTTFTQSTPVAIPTGPAVVTSTVVVSGVGTYLWDANLLTNITHTFAADLDMTIQSPAGTVVTLSTDNGAGNDNVFNGTDWDDDANPAGQVPYTTNSGLASDHAYVNLTLASPLVPEEALAAFIGENPNGTWTLTVSDDLAGDGGSIASWSVEVTTFPSAPTNGANTVVTQSTPVAIPTGPAVVTSTNTVAGGPTAICGITVDTTITHTFSADIDMTLMSPTGTVVTFSTDNGAGNDNTFNGTAWNDDANPLGQVPYTTNNGVTTDNAYVNLTTATPLVVEEALGAFLGENANGTWTLTVSDDLAGDGGSIAAWTLTLTPCTCAVLADSSITKTDGLTNATPGQATTYTITVSNAGPNPDPAANVVDNFPAGFTGATWTCVGAGGGTCTANGAGNINDTANLPSGGSVTYTVNGTVGLAFVGVLSNTATVTAGPGITDPNTGNNSAQDDTTVASAASVSGTKTVSGDFTEGGAIQYTVVLSNASASAQLDNPGDEFTDNVPATVTVTGASATSGTAAFLGNTVTWNGSIPGNGSVTITIDATINAGTLGQTISNQGTINFDADGNGTNESTTSTDDPAAGGQLDPTDLIVGGNALEIPTLSPLGLALLMLAMAAAAWAVLRRRRTV